MKRSQRERLVIVGNGMAGGRLVEDLLARGASERYAITVFGDEPHAHYNRILLSGVLAGSHRAADIVIKTPAWYFARGVNLRAGVRVERIDIERAEVIAASGEAEKYDALVLATGSRPVIPDMEGIRRLDGGLKDGVFVFRTIDDCDRIGECADRAQRAVVIGGGLLGLEAAFGLLKRGLEVHIVHLMPHVMESQLDVAAGTILRRQLERMGLHLHFEKKTTAILGNAHVSGVAFDEGKSFECDMVVIAAGIRPNVDLAHRASIPVRNGVLVGDDLASPIGRGVHAVGECAEHRGRVYGLVAPIWEQTAVLAGRLSGTDPDAVYCGSRLSTKLKVAGVDLAVMGCKEPEHPDDEVVSYVEGHRGVYKKLIVRDGRLLGAIIMGDGAIVPSVVHAFTESTSLAANRAEILFPFAFEAVTTPVDRLPDSAQICDCNAVSKARIVQAVLEGARSLGTVCDRTRAGTGCGSCRPEVQAIIDFACGRLASSPVGPLDEPQEECA